MVAETLLLQVRARTAAVKGLLSNAARSALCAKFRRTGGKLGTRLGARVPSAERRHNTVHGARMRVAIALLLQVWAGIATIQGLLRHAP